jgi:serine/threonine protein kinase/WD40 repeat protein
MIGQDTRIGTRLGKYCLVQRLGEGGMGVVYAAEDPVLGRRVALKVLSGAALREPGAAQRFFLEARAAARINHPNVVTVHDIGQQGDVCYIVMELVEGASAQALLYEQGALPWPQATRLIASVCAGLAAAHAAGLIHRDIKPANILLGRGGSVKLSDFGLVKAPRLSSAHATHQGAILGTPHYMSPEQCAGETIDERADCYALGGTYYALLTGRPPYDDADSVKVLYAHCAGSVPDPRGLVPALPEACAAIVAKAMAKKRGDRFRSSQEMQTALTALLGTLPAEPAPLSIALPPPASAPVPLDNTSLSHPLVLASSPPPTQAPRRRFGLVPAALALVIGVSLIGAIVFFRPPPEQPRPLVVKSETENPSSAPFPEGQRVTLERRRTLVKHEGQARGLAFGGRRLASVGADKMARVWDIDHLEAPPRVFRHSQELKCVALTPDGSWLATGDWRPTEHQEDHTTISLFHLDTGKLLGTIRNAAKPWSLAFHPSGRRLAIGGGAWLQLIELSAAGQELKRARLPGSQYVFTCVAFTSDGKHLGASTYAPGAFWLDGTDLSQVGFFPSEVELFAGLSLSADGKRLAFAKRRPGSNELFLWEPATEKPPRLVTVETGDGVISWIAFAPGGRQIAYGGTYGGPVKLHDLVSGQAMVFPTEAQGNVTGLAFSPDGRLLAATVDDGSVLAWDVVQDK